MLKDTEQSYRGFTIDVYESSRGGWVADYWNPGIMDKCGQVTADRRRVVIQLAKYKIDTLLGYIPGEDHQP